jgi:hypothetical protein
MLSRRALETGEQSWAIATLLTGLVLGSLRFILEIQNKSAAFEDGLLKYIATVNFLHYAAFLFAVSCLVMVAVSLSTPPPSRAQLVTLTMGEVDGSSPVSETERGEHRRFGAPRAHPAALCRTFR